MTNWQQDEKVNPQDYTMVTAFWAVPRPGGLDVRLSTMDALDKTWTVEFVAPTGSQAWDMAQTIRKGLVAHDIAWDRGEFVPVPRLHVFYVEADDAYDVEIAGVDGGPVLSLDRFTFTQTNGG